MFNRNRDASPNDPAGNRPGTPTGAPQDSAAAPLIPKPHRPEIPNYQQPAQSTAAQSAAKQPQKADVMEPEGSKLTVGRDIHLKGEITSCDVLVVEGKVEASMNSRYIRVASEGMFQGDCEIDTADISGHFDGNLLARKRLIVRSTGRVTGSTRYGEIEIEAGGVIAGKVEWLDPNAPESASITAASKAESSKDTKGKEPEVKKDNKLQPAR